MACAWRVGPANKGKTGINSGGASKVNGGRSRPGRWILIKTSGAIKRYDTVVGFCLAGEGYRSAGRSDATIVRGGRNGTDIKSMTGCSGIATGAGFLLEIALNSRWSRIGRDRTGDTAFAGKSAKIKGCSSAYFWWSWSDSKNS